MVKVRAFKLRNRMIVHFFDSGSRDSLACPECSWSGTYSEEPSVSETTLPEAIDCPRCSHPLAILTQPVAELIDLPTYM